MKVKDVEAQLSFDDGMNVWITRLGVIDNWIDIETGRKFPRPLDGREILFKELNERVLIDIGHNEWRRPKDIRQVTIEETERDIAIVEEYESA